METWPRIIMMDRCEFKVLLQAKDVGSDSAASCSTTTTANCCAPLDWIIKSFVSCLWNGVSHNRRNTHLLHAKILGIACHAHRHRVSAWLLRKSTGLVMPIVRLAYDSAASETDRGSLKPIPRQARSSPFSDPTTTRQRPWSLHFKYRQTATR